jgi:ankyrin repeat protein
MPRKASHGRDRRERRKDGVTQYWKFGRLALLSLGLVIAAPAAAQFSESYKFLDAVRKSDTAALVKALDVPGVTLINTRDRSTGETALIIAIGRRDLAVSAYLLSKGARPELSDNEGRTPLMMAVEKRFFEGAQLLLSKKANPNQSNASGETPLIRAVQFGDIEMVRLLLTAGADPNKRDNLAGLSAIDYAQRGTRVPGMSDLLNATQKKAPAKGVQGPQL